MNSRKKNKKFIGKNNETKVEGKTKKIETVLALGYRDGYIDCMNHGFYCNLIKLISFADNSLRR